MAKIAPKNAKEALIEALVMLDMVRRGETFAAQDWHDRFDLMRLHLTPNQREIVRAKVAAEIDDRRAGRSDATPRELADLHGTSEIDEEATQADADARAGA